MIKHLTKTGNSLALILDRPFLDSTKIDAATPLEISTDGDVIVITPVCEPGRVGKLQRGVESINERFAGVFRRLAK